MSEWIKCSDRLPPIRQRVLVFRLGKKTNDGPFFAMTCGNEHRPWRYIDGDRCDITPTHWQPLPAPPTEQHPATLEATMEHEIVVEGFVLQVEVTHCENTPPCPGTWSSDWDAQGCRELEFKVVSAICYDDGGIRMDVDPLVLPLLTQQYGRHIETALWVEIDASQRRQRWAA